MSKLNIDELSFDEIDEVINPKSEDTEFDTVVDEAVSRRGFLGGVVAFGTTSFLLGTSTLTPSPARAHGRFAFEAVAPNSEDTITVPEGYSWQTLIRWGDPLWSKGINFDQSTRGTGESQELAFGDNNDGMALFSASGGRTVMAVNNEYTNRSIMYGARETKLPETADDVRKGKAAHGISVFEIRQAGDEWQVVKDSPFNRRITGDSPMRLAGPAAGHDLLKTQADPTGTKSLGTWNNCGNGRTPWGTYLACEENFNGYFSSSDPANEVSNELKRYGVSNKDWGYGWGKVDERFDISKHPNEPNRAGYIVEIDPLDPNSIPVKRTGLGRFKHENAEVVLAANGRVVVYMGDDERGEFLYRFVSDGAYAAGGDTSELLDKGTLYAARFNADGKGEWLALTPETTGMSSLA